MRLLVSFLMAIPAIAATRNLPVVEVFLPPVSNDLMKLAFARAQRVVIDIYSDAGIRVIWRSTASRPSGCSKQPMHRRIVVTLAAKTPAGMSDEALAYSKPYVTEGPCVA